MYNGVGSIVFGLNVSPRGHLSTVWLGLAVCRNTCPILTLARTVSMVRKNFISILTLVLVMLTFTTVHGQQEKSRSSYSGSGRNPPKVLKDRQIVMLKKILAVLPEGEDPIEIIAIAMVESSLTAKAVSHTGDYGILQVNCRIHRKRLKKHFGIKKCETELLDIKKNVLASTHILGLFRSKYKQCRGEKAYACYNGGQGWRSNLKKCLQKCEATMDPGVSCRKCGRPQRYSNSVKKHKRFLKKKYLHLFR
jgi:hypothetical protein